MGDIPNDNSDSRNFFATQRNDIPPHTQAFQDQVYTNYQPGAPGRVQGDRMAGNGAVTIIEDNGDRIYAAPGSVVYLHHGRGEYNRVGGSQAGYMPDYEQHRPGPWMPPGAVPGRLYDNYQSNYQNVAGNGWEMPPPYRPNPAESFVNGLGTVLGAVGGAFLGRAAFGGFRGEYHHGYMPPPWHRPGPFIGGRGFGTVAGAFLGAEVGSQLTQPSWAYANNNYYNTGGYYNQAQYYAPQQNYAQYDAYGNPIG